MNQKRSVEYDIIVEQKKNGGIIMRLEIGWIWLKDMGVDGTISIIKFCHI